MKRISERDSILDQRELDRLKKQKISDFYHKRNSLRILKKHVGKLAESLSRQLKYEGYPVRPEEIKIGYALFAGNLLSGVYVISRSLWNMFYNTGRDSIARVNVAPRIVVQVVPEGYQYNVRNDATGEMEQKTASIQTGWY